MRQGLPEMEHFRSTLLIALGAQVSTGQGSSWLCTGQPWGIWTTTAQHHNLLTAFGLSVFIFFFARQERRLKQEIS